MVLDNQNCYPNIFHHFLTSGVLLGFDSRLPSDILSVQWYGRRNVAAPLCEITICLLGATLSIGCAYIRLSSEIESVGSIFKEIQVTILIS
jgi:hypothetical protein